jgi:hypothetical protein
MTVNKPSENWHTLTLYYLEAEGVVVATYSGILFSELQILCLHCTSVAVSRLY